MNMFIMESMVTTVDEDIWGCQLVKPDEPYNLSNHPSTVTQYVVRCQQSNLAMICL